MSEDIEALDDELRGMVENHWRNLIRLAGANPQIAGEEVFRFEAMTDQLASQQPPGIEACYRSTLQLLRGEYAEWERTNPDSLRKSLNVTGGGRGTATAWLANLETPSSLDLLPQLDAFWRGLFAQGTPSPQSIQVQWGQFIGGLQAQVSRLSQPEQDGLLTRVALRNAEYLAIAGKDREALKSQLGATATSSMIETTGSPMGDMIVNTAVRATVWQGIGALFRSFR
jgi:hypothetical protein